MLSRHAIFPTVYTVYTKNWKGTTVGKEVAKQWQWDNYPFIDSFCCCCCNEEEHGLWWKCTQLNIIFIFCAGWGCVGKGLGYYQRKYSHKNLKILKTGELDFKNGSFNCIHSITVKVILRNLIVIGVMHETIIRSSSNFNLFPRTMNKWIWYNAVVFYASFKVHDVLFKPNRRFI